MFHKTSYSACMHIKIEKNHLAILETSLVDDSFCTYAICGGVYVAVESLKYSFKSG